MRARLGRPQDRCRRGSFFRGGGSDLHVQLVVHIGETRLLLNRCTRKIELRYLKIKRAPVEMFQNIKVSGIFE